MNIRESDVLNYIALNPFRIAPPILTFLYAIIITPLIASYSPLDSILTTILTILSILELNLILTFLVEKYDNKIIEHAEYIAKNYNTISPILEDLYGYKCSSNRTPPHSLLFTISITKDDNNKPIITFKNVLGSIEKLKYDRKKIKDLLNAINDIIKTV